MSRSSLDTLISNAPILDEDGKQYVHGDRGYDRVTTILHKALPAYLAPWAEGVGRKAVHTTYLNSGRSLPDSYEELEKVVQRAGLTTEHEKKAGGLRGAEIHFAMEAWIKQGVPPSLGDFEPEVRPYAQTLARWLMDYEPEFEASEIMLFHPELGYAGTCDAIGRVTKRPKGVRHPDVTGKRIVLDFKTNKNKSVYEQHYAQLSAYELALNYHGVDVEGSAVVAIGPSPGKGTPYRFAVNFWEPEDWLPVMNLYMLLQKVKAQNPNSRAKSNVQSQTSKETNDSK